VKTRLMIVDDHEVVRMGLRAALDIEPDFTVVAEAGNGKEAIEKARAHQPDIVLMDVRMDGMDGIEACRELRSELPDLRAFEVVDDPGHKAESPAAIAYKLGKDPEKKKRRRGRGSK